jgi:type II secretory pathway component PulF
MQATAEWRKFALFCHRLAAMLRTGIGLVQAIDMLVLDELDPKEKRKLDLFRLALYSGVPFPQALRYVIPYEYRASVCRLDQVPDIPEFLSRLGAHVTERSDVVGTVLKQAVYPMVLIGSTVATVLFFILGLVPRYVDFFIGSGLPLPGILRGLMVVSTGLSSPGFAGIGGVCGVVLVGWGGRRSIRWFKQRVGGGDGRSDLFWMLGIMLQSGVPLIKAVDVVSPSDRDIEARWRNFRLALLGSGRLAENAYLYLGLTRYQRELILCGERSGSLAVSLIDVASDLVAADQAQLKQTVAWIQPVMLAISAVTIVFSVYITMIPVTSLINYNI